MKFSHGAKGTRSASYHHSQPLLRTEAERDILTTRLPDNFPATHQRPGAQATASLSPLGFSTTQGWLGRDVPGRRERASFYLPQDYSCGAKQGKTPIPNGVPVKSPRTAKKSFPAMEIFCEHLNN